MIVDSTFFCHVLTLIDSRSLGLLTDRILAELRTCQSIFIYTAGAGYMYHQWRLIVRANINSIITIKSVQTLRILV